MFSVSKWQTLKNFAQGTFNCAVVRVLGCWYLEELYVRQAAILCHVPPHQHPGSTDTIPMGGSEKAREEAL
jgi:hypothetical protein